MDKKPKVSIIIVTFNAGKFLQTALDSIYKQRYPNLEVVIVDGVSKDNTLDILKANADKITYVSEKDQGIFDAMNKATRIATGDYVYFLGADDILYDEFSDLAEKLDDPTAIYYGNVNWGGTRLTGAVKSPYQLAKTNICHQAIVYPASVFKKYQYNLDYPVDADHFLNILCWADKAYHFKYYNITIAFYNDTGNSFVKTDILFEKHRPAITYKYFGFSAWARYIFRVYKAKRSAGKNK